MNTTAQQIKVVIQKWRNLDIGSTTSLNMIEDLIDTELKEQP